MVQTTGKRTSVSKKILSVFLSLLMIMSVCYSGIGVIAEAAASTSQINVLKSALNDFANSGETGSYSASNNGSNTVTITDNTSKGYVYKVLIALQPVLEGERGSYNWFSKMRPRVISRTGASGASATLLNNLIPMLTNYDRSDANKLDTDSGWITWGGGSAPGNSLADLGKVKVSVTRTLDSALLEYSDVSKLPNSVNLTVSYAVNAGHSSTTWKESKGSFITKQWKYHRVEYYYYNSAFSLSYSNANSEAISNIRAYYNFFTKAKVDGQTVATLVANNTVSSIGTIVNDNAAYSAKINGLSATVKDHFFTDPTVAVVNNYIAYCLRAQAVLQQKSKIDWFKSAIAAGYDNVNIDQMNSLYTEGLAKYNDLNSLSSQFKTDAKETLGMDLDAYNAWLVQLKRDIDLYYLRALKKSIDNTIADNPKVNDDNVTSLTGEEFLAQFPDSEYPNSLISSINGTFNGYAETLDRYRASSPNEVADVFTDGVDYVYKFKTNINYMAVEANAEDDFAPYLEHFLPYVFTSPAAYGNDAEMARFTEDYAKNIDLNNTYNSYTGKINADLQKRVFSFYNGDDLVFLPDAVSAYLAGMKADLIKRNHDQIQTVYDYAVMAGGTTSSIKVDFNNFLGLQAAVNNLDAALYDYCAYITSNGNAGNPEKKNWVTAEDMNIYGKSQDFINAVKKFKETKGLPYDQMHYDEDGVFVIRYAGDQKDASGNQIGYPSDIARDGAEDNYEVTTQKILDTISKLDTFITSEDFARLIDFKDKDGNEVSNLSDYIETVLNEKLFTNEMINTIVASIFPMVCNAIKDLVPQIKNMGITGIGAPNDPAAAFRVDVGALAGGNPGGALDVYMDGQKGTVTVKQLLASLGINVYPSQLASALPNSGKYVAIRNALNSCGDNWSKLLDADGKLNFDWGVTDYNSFTSAAGSVFNSILPLLQTVLCGKTYNKSVDKLAYGAGNFNYKAMGFLNLKMYIEARINANLTIDGLQVYKTVWIPIMEALGIADNGYRFKSLGQNASAAQMVDALFSPLLELIDQLKSQPIDKVCSMLPQVLYFLSFDGVQELINSININMHVDMSIDDFDKFELWGGNLTGLADLLKGTINGAIPNFDFTLKLADMVNLEDMLGFDYTNINIIASYVLDKLGMDVSVPVMNAGNLIRCSTYDTNASSQRLSGKRLKITADKANVFYDVLSYLVGALGDRNLIDSLVRVISEKNGTTVELPEIIYTLVENVSGNPKAALAALIELFNPVEYDEMQMNWYQSDKDKNVSDMTDLKSLVYLTYNTNWTREKSQYIIDNIDEIVKSVTGTDDTTSVDEKIREAINGMFNNKNFTALVKELVSLGYTLDNQFVYDLCKRETGVDLQQWAEAFGYAFPTILEKYEKTALEPGDAGYNSNFGTVSVAVDSVKDEETGETRDNYTWYINGEKFEDGNRKQFLSLFFEVVEPMAPLISMFMTGEDVSLFANAVTIKGYEGYSNAVAYVFEMLGVPNVMSQAEYNAYVEENGAADAFEYLTNQLFDWLDSQLNGSAFKNLISLLPNFLYFVESDGLSTIIFNVLQPLTTVIDTVRPIADVDLDTIASVIVSDLLGGNSFSLDHVLDVIAGNFDASGYEKWYDVHTKQLTFTEILRLADIYFGTDLRYSPLVLQGIESICASPEKFDSKSASSVGYRASCDPADGLTILVSSLLECLNHSSDLTGGKTNGEIICDFIDSKTGKDDAKKIWDMVKTIFDGIVSTDTDVNWLYFYDDPDNTNPKVTDLVNAQLPTKSIVYLGYNNNWNKETADKLSASASEIINSILESKQGTDLATYLQALLSDNVYTDEVLNKLVVTIVKALNGLDKSLRDTISVVISTDGIDAWFDMCDIAEDGTVTCNKVWNINGDKQKFIDALSEVLAPANDLLGWLFFGDSYTFFTSSKTEDGKYTLEPIIDLAGNPGGYAYGIIPLFEALGCEMKSPDAYVVGADGKHDMSTFVKDLLTSVLDRVDEITSGDAVGNILDLLPNLIYFINADGLKVTVNNILSPVYDILDKLLPVIGDANLDDTLGFKLSDLSTETIFEILKDKAGITVDPQVIGVIKYLYVGDITLFESANGRMGLKMGYTDEITRAEMLTILFSVALEILGDSANEQAFRDMLGDDTYTVVMNVLRLNARPMHSIPWLYTEDAGTDKVFSGIETSNIFEYGYGKYWTRDKAQYIADNIECFINDMIQLLGIEMDGIKIDSLEDIINSFIDGSLYSNKVLSKIYNGLMKALNKLNEVDTDGKIKEVIKSSLGVDLTFYDTYVLPEIAEGDRSAFTTELLNMLRPLYPVLKWLLAEQDIAFFNDAEGNDKVVLPGDRGYNYGIIPLLEALECEGIKTESEYYADIAAEDDALVLDIINPLLDKIDVILADPANEIFELLPNVAYFVNSNGLDTVWQNTLNSVYTVLDALQPLVNVDLYEVIGINLDGMKFEDLVQFALSKVKDSTGFDLAELVVDAAAEMTTGKLISFTSLNGEQAYRMEYAGKADRADMVTIILRLVLKFLNTGDNTKTLEKIILEKTDMSEETYKFMFSFIESLAQYCSDAEGMDKTLYILYYTFYGINTGAHEANAWLKDYNSNWEFFYGMLRASDQQLLNDFADFTSKIFDKYTKDIIDDGGLASSGLIKFFQKIIDIIKKLIDFFTKLFS